MTREPRALVLVVEDNSDLAYGLRNNLEIEGYEVLVATDGQSGLDCARANRPDLILLDLTLPELNGYRVLQALRRDDLATPVLILTARGTETDKVLGFRLGADDYVTKPFGVLELLARVEALLRRSGVARDRNGGGPQVPQQAATDGSYPIANRDSLRCFGSVTVDVSSRTCERGGESVALTPKEFDLLVALIELDGAVGSRTDLLREVWGHRAEVMSRTVDTHMFELRRKLEEDPASPVHLLTVHKAGYRLRRLSAKSGSAAPDRGVASI
jgi:two-component system alkaline phosphatase synthesis response regulator PhoP